MRIVTLGPEYQVALIVAVASHLVAYLSVGLPNVKYMAVALGSNLILLFAYAFVIRSFEGLRSRGAAETKAKERIQRVLALPFPEVKQRALSLIADSRKFRYTKGNSSDNPAIQRLGPVLQDFFSQFETVEQVGGDSFVSRKVVSESSLRPGFLTIGSDFAHSELVVRRGEDRVFIVTDSEHKLDDGLPTIYHNICLLGRE